MPLSNTRLAEEPAGKEGRRKRQIRIAQNGGLVAIYFIIRNLNILIVSRTKR
jgi:hypothetical protein